MLAKNALEGCLLQAKQLLQAEESEAIRMRTFTAFAENQLGIFR